MGADREKRNVQKILEIKDVSILLTLCMRHRGPNGRSSRDHHRQSAASPVRWPRSRFLKGNEGESNEKYARHTEKRATRWVLTGNKQRLMQRGPKKGKKLTLFVLLSFYTWQHLTKPRLLRPELVACTSRKSSRSPVCRYCRWSRSMYCPVKWRAYASAMRGRTRRCTAA
jgi:hypothetical protein